MRTIQKESYRYPLVLGILAALLFLPALGARDFWAPVEPRYAEIARVMFAKKEWVLPTINGDLYTDKPILYFWLVLLGSALLGSVSEWAVRLPSALSALGLVLTTYFLGRDLFGPKIGFMAAVVLATSARVLWEGRWAHTDMPFTFFFTLSLYFFARAIVQKRGRKDFLLAYAFTALATLTKGLIGAVLPGLILLIFAVAKRQWRSLSEWHVPAGILVFLVITVPWFAWVGVATDGRWLGDFILTHHVQRYTAGLGHRQPFYYYLVNFPVDFLPWTVFAVPAIFANRPRAQRLKEPIPQFLLIWFLAVFLFFSFSDTKRALYLLPLFPPAAFFVAGYFADLLSGELHQDALYLWLARIFFHLLWVGSLTLPVAAWFLQREALPISIPLALLMIAGALIALFSLARRMPAGVFCSTALTMAAGMIYAAIWVLPYMDQFKSPRPFASEVTKRVPPSRTLYIFADTMNDFNFYTAREVIPVLSTTAEVKNLLAQAEGAYMVVRERDLKRLGLEGEVRTVAAAAVGGKEWRLVTSAKRP